MSEPSGWFLFLGLVTVASPLVLTAILGVSSLLDRKLDEAVTTTLVYACIASGLVAAVTVLGIMLVQGTRHVPIDLGEWVSIAHEPHHYHFSVKFVFDRLSVPFAILSYVLSGTIGAFAAQYMHRERGFNRFFTLYAIFLLGMVTASLAGTIETLFTGWELVGLSSALLVAFFQERPAPARNGLWVWTVYRVSDAALLLAAVVMHRINGEGDFDKLLGAGPWPDEFSTISSHQAGLVGLLLLVAAAGKSALVPFSGWLPKAMEGPTPSSAIFYGALSVHLGAFLLLRVNSLLEHCFWLCMVIVILGLTTALLAYLAGSVQTDIKSALSFASLTQVGIIVAEIGTVSTFGTANSPPHHLWYYIPLVHILGHASLRTLQFVRAPSLLKDYRSLENAIGRNLPKASNVWRRVGTNRLRAQLYRLGLERGFLDALLMRYYVDPFVRVMRWCDRLERRWTDSLSGASSREPAQVNPQFGTIEELL